MTFYQNPVALFIALCLVLIANVTSQAGTTKSVWQQTTDCAVSISLPEFANEPTKCLAINNSGTLNSYQ